MSELDRFLNQARRAPMVMGILNMTPDSFSGEGLHYDKDAAKRQAEEMIGQGARIIDIGGESTRPGAVEVSAEEEAARTLPVIQAVKESLAEGQVILSIDTYKAETAKRAIAAGAQIVNDVWGLSREPQIAAIAAEAGAGVVITYNRGDIDADIDVVGDMLAFCERQIAFAESAGVHPGHIILDPGIGFAKTPEQNFECLRGLARLSELERLILVGVSRKSLFGHLTGASVDQRLPATLAAGLISVQKGAHILRVHDVAEHIQMLAVARALAGA